MVSIRFQSIFLDSSVLILSSIIKSPPQPYFLLILFINNFFILLFIIFSCTKIRHSKTFPFKKRNIRKICKIFQTKIYNIFLKKSRIREFLHLFTKKIINDVEIFIIQQIINFSFNVFLSFFRGFLLSDFELCFA